MRSSTRVILYGENKLSEEWALNAATSEVGKKREDSVNVTEELQSIKYGGGKRASLVVQPDNDA